MVIVLAVSHAAKSDFVKVCPYARRVISVHTDEVA